MGKYGSPVQETRLDLIEDVSHNLQQSAPLADSVRFKI